MAGLGLILLQLKSDAAERRTAKALDMVARFSTEPVSRYRETLLRAWIDEREKLTLIRRMGGARSDDADVFVAAVIEDYNRNHPDEQIYVAIHEVADFYDQLSICIDSGLCDEKVTRRYFAGSARQFACLYADIVKQQAEIFSTADLGHGLATLRDREGCG